MSLNGKMEFAPSPSQLQGESLAWAIEVLERVGFDANTAHAADWLPRIKDSLGEEIHIGQGDLDAARKFLRERDPGKEYDTVVQKRHNLALELTLKPEGRQALRAAMKQVPPALLIEILDFRNSQ
jgi:hypothetical protein